MNHTEQQIWIPEAIYGNEQTTSFSGTDNSAENYTVAEFEKGYSFSKRVVAKLRFSGDTSFQLFCNGRIAPEPTYCFDYSHAWGGTPLYSLPKALLGLEITKPGMKKIKLSPSLLGLSKARVELLTRFGKVVCEMEEGEKPQISNPKEINVILE